MTAEELRETVRSELLLLVGKLQKRQKRRWLEFLNSGFGLWILSSLVLGGLTFAYSKMSAIQAAEEGRRARLDRLETEIELRFEKVIGKIEYLQRKRGAALDRPDDTGLRIIVEVSSDNALTPDDAGGLFSKPNEDQQFQIEFKDYTIRSLFAEAFFLARGKRARSTMQSSLDQLDQAREFDRKWRIARVGAVKLIGTEAEAKRFGFTKGAHPSAAEGSNLPSIYEYQQFEDNIYHAWKNWLARERSTVPFW